MDLTDFFVGIGSSSTSIPSSAIGLAGIGLARPLALTGTMGCLTPLDSRKMLPDLPSDSIASSSSDSVVESGSLSSDPSQAAFFRRFLPAPLSFGDFRFLATLAFSTFGLPSALALASAFGFY